VTDSLEALAPAGSDVGEIAVRYRRPHGVFVDTTLNVLPVDEVLAGSPVRRHRRVHRRKSGELVEPGRRRLVYPRSD
jgi:hypothetical protein